MKKIRFFSLFLAITLSLSLAIPTLAIEDMEVQARNAVLIDATYGDVLYEQNAHDKVYPASTTKLMTTLLVLEAVQRGNLAPDQLIAYPDDTAQVLASIGSNPSALGLKVGDTLSLSDWLHALILLSANEVGNILALSVCDDVDSFVAKMNSRMKQLGGTDTHFANTHGLHDENHYTTAYDMALVLQELLKHPLFEEIASAPLHTTTATDTFPETEFFNTNGLVSPWYYSGYTYSKSIGGKTGYTPEAGYCLAMAAENTASDEVFISVIMGADVVTAANGSTQRLNFSETIRLLDWGFDSFKRTTIAAGDTPVAALPVTLSQEADEVLLRPTGSIQRTLPADLDLDKIEREISLTADSVEAPVAEGDVLGQYTLSYEGEVYGVFDLVALTSVERSELLETKQEFTELLALRDHLFDGSITFSPMAIIAMAVIVVALIIVVSLILARHHAAKMRRPNRRGNYSGRR